MSVWHKVSVCCPQVSGKKQQKKHTLHEQQYILQSFIWSQLKSLSLALARRELEQFKAKNHGLDFQEKKKKKQHVRSPQLTPKHKKIVFTCLLRNINALGVLDSFLCSVEARFLGKPSKIPHNFKKSTLWKQIALTKTGQKAAWVCTMNTFASIISWLGKKIEEPNWIAGT